MNRIPLQPGRFIDSDHPKVHRISRAARFAALATARRAVSLYYAVRDRIRYNPFLEFHR